MIIIFFVKALVSYMSEVSTWKDTDFHRDFSYSRSYFLLTAEEIMRSFGKTSLLKWRCEYSTTCGNRVKYFEFPRKKCKKVVLMVFLDLTIRERNYCQCKRRQVLKRNYNMNFQCCSQKRGWVWPNMHSKANN